MGGGSQNLLSHVRFPNYEFEFEISKVSFVDRVYYVYMICTY